MDRMQINSAFADKVARGIFGPAVRRIPEDAREDRLADAIAQTWSMFDRYARRGVVLDDAILVHSCRQRAHDLGRHFVLAGDARRARDVYNPTNYLNGRVELWRIDDADEDDDQWLLGLATEMSMDPTEALVSAIDLRNWLGELDDADVAVLAMRLAGHTLGDIGDVTGASVSGAFARCRRLGQRLREHIADARRESCDQNKTRGGDAREEMEDGSRSGGVGLRARCARRAGCARA
jgi:hypothetical protein